MSENKLKINNKFGFGAKLTPSIIGLEKALNLFNSSYEKAKSLEDDFDIFLDTNVLTHYYKISFSERELFLKALEKYKGRIFLTKQVEKEFLDNRVSIIKNFNNRLYESISTKFKAVDRELQKLREGKINSLESYLTDKVIKNDYSSLHESLNSLYNELSGKIKNIFTDDKFSEEIKEKQKEVDEEISKALEDNNKLEKEDTILNLFSEFKVLEPLDDEEISYIYEKYKELKKIFDEIKSDINKFSQFTFPCCGERKDKSDPVGDFIIVNEIMKYMKSNQRNVIFLTNDVSKKDWFNEQEEQYTHYISEFYTNTDKMMFIFNANKTLDVDFENIYEAPQKKNEPNQYNVISKIENSNDTVLTNLEKNVIAVICNAQEQPDLILRPRNISETLLKLGYKQFEINIAIRGLISKEYIKITDIEDENGYVQFSGYEVLRIANDWIYKNHNEVLQMIEKNEQIIKYIEEEEDVDLPF